VQQGHAGLVTGPGCGYHAGGHPRNLMKPMLLAGSLAAAALLGAAPTWAEMRPGAVSETERAALHEEIRAYLLENPEILSEMIALLEQQREEETSANDRDLVADNTDAIFDDGFSFVGGNPYGTVTVVEFLDYQCTFCRRAHPDLQELLAADGDIRWIVKELPILGPGSELASRAAIAVLISEGPEAYADLNDRLMRLEGGITDASLDAALEEAGLDPEAIRAAMADPEVDRRLAETRQLAGELGISGTPTFVWGDRMVRGYVPLAQMETLVDELRAMN
jgi:protein-disulfide isomerase